MLNIKVDGLVKSPNPVTPAKAGVQKLLKVLDSGLVVIPDLDPGRNDDNLIFGLFTKSSELIFILI